MKRVVSLALLAAAGCGAAADTGGEGGFASFASYASSSASMSASHSASSGGSAGPVLGLPCDSDVECGDEAFTCLRASGSDVDGGGPAGGYCSRACSTMKDCGGSNRCVDGFCWLACEHAVPPITEKKLLVPDKCHGREDLACRKNENRCIPVCGSDPQCPAGRRCDPKTGLCKDAQHVTPGLPLGATCTFGEPSECAGICMQGPVLCTQPCVMGGLPVSFECGGYELGACVFYPLPDVGPGDLGYCTRSCTKHDDCSPPDTWCRRSVPDFGYCVFASPCPAGTCEEPYECADTAWGPYCVDPLYPPG